MCVELWADPWLGAHGSVWEAMSGARDCFISPDTDVRVTFYQK